MSKHSEISKPEGETGDFRETDAKEPQENVIEGTEQITDDVADKKAAGEEDDENETVIDNFFFC